MRYQLGKPNWGSILSSRRFLLDGKVVILSDKQEEIEQTLDRFPIFMMLRAIPEHSDRSLNTN